MELHFKTFLLEVYHDKHVNYNKQLMDIYVDPDRRELRELSTNDRMVRGVVTNEHFYAWKNFGDYHSNIMKLYPEMQNGLPIQLWWGNGEAYVMVTDASARTSWHHNPKVADFLHTHPYLKRFPKIDISYYDEDIVGDWKDLKR